MSVHKSHSDILKRLNRARGHLDAVIKMVEEHKPCLDIAQQMQAVIKALTTAKSIHVTDHLENCFEKIFKDISKKDREKIDDFKEIIKYL